MKLIDVYQDGQLAVPAGGTIDVLFNSSRTNEAGLPKSTIGGGPGVHTVTAQAELSHPEMVAQIVQMTEVLAKEVGTGSLAVQRSQQGPGMYVLRVSNPTANQQFVRPRASLQLRVD